MRGKDQTELLEVGHHVAHRGRRQRNRQDARQIARADRLAGGEIALHNGAENLARALVERRQTDLRRADRDVVGGHGIYSLHQPTMTAVTALFKPSIWLWCAPNPRNSQRFAHDPEKWEPVFGQDHAPALLRGSSRCGRAADKSTNCVPSRSSAAWSNMPKAPVS